MSTSLMFYNTLDDRLFQKIGYNQQPLRAFYINEDDENINMSVELLEGQENTYQVVDPKVHWDANMHNIYLEQEIEIVNPAFLFGNEGLVSEDAIIGIAFRWHSRDSAQQRVIPISEITIEATSSYYNTLEINIERGLLRGKVTFEVVLYLVNPGKHMANIVPGTILGILDSKDMLFDGDTSMFPIVEVKDASKPLWWVMCDFDDPLYDKFNEDNTAIVLNMGHRHAKQLKTEKGIGSSPLLLEIIATGLQIIIEKAKHTGEWQQIMNNNTEPGSIGEAIYYFVNTFEWNTSSPDTLLRSIREDFDKRFK